LLHAKLPMPPILDQGAGVHESVHGRPHARRSRSSPPPNTTRNIVASSACW